MATGIAKNKRRGQAPRRRARDAKFDDVQIENGALSEHGERIKIHGQKFLAYQNKAEEVAGYELKKATEHLTSRAQLLADVKSKCTSAGFKAFKEKYAPELSRSRLYQLLAIGSGKTTVEETRAATRERTAKSRTKVSATECLVADKPETLLSINEAITSPAVTLPPGNANESTADSADKRKAEYAALDDGGNDGEGHANGHSDIAVADAAPTITDTTDAVSVAALAKFKDAVDELLPKMNAEDLAEAHRYALHQHDTLFHDLHAKQMAKAN